MDVADMGPNPILDPQSYRATRRRHTAAESLPGWCFTSPLFFRRELETIFRKTWHMVCRSERLTEPGDYTVADLFGNSIVLIRKDDGEIAAFHNSCRHRGTRLLAGTGRCKRIVCPFHRWTYGLDGRLLAAPSMESTPRFQRSDYPLHAVRVSEWAGFLFVCIDPGAPSLENALGDLPAQLRPYGLEAMRCVRTNRYRVQANWKLYVQVDMETYHTPNVHPDSIGDQAIERRTGRGDYETVFQAGTRTISIVPGDDGPLFDPLPEVLASERPGTFFTVIYPGLFVVATLDSAWWIHKVPVSATETDVHVGFLFPERTAARPDFEAIARRYYARWDRVIEEDNDIVEVQQAGIERGNYMPGPFADREAVLHAIDNWVLDRVLDGRAPAAP